MTGVVVFGATGRMGQALIRELRRAEREVPAGGPSVKAAPGGTDQGAAAAADATAPGWPGSGDGAPLRLCGAVASSASSRLGRDAAAEDEPTGVTLTADAASALRGAAVAVEFSAAAGVAAHARACAHAGVPLLVGSTGLDEAAVSALRAAADRVAVLIAPNTSVGIAVLADLLRRAVAALGEGFDVEIGEIHHRRKRDAPSGTALALGEAAAEARGRRLADVAVFDRHGAFAPRASGSIGFSVQRAGDVVGEHTVTLAGDGERLELSHRATDRAAFARGALRAARWLIGRPPGWYSMSDVLAIGGATRPGATQPGEPRPGEARPG